MHSSICVCMLVYMLVGLCSCVSKCPRTAAHMHARVDERFDHNDWSWRNKHLQLLFCRLYVHGWMQMSIWVSMLVSMLVLACSCVSKCPHTTARTHVRVHEIFDHHDRSWWNQQSQLLVRKLYVHVCTQSSTCVSMMVSMLVLACSCVNKCPRTRAHTCMHTYIKVSITMIDHGETSSDNCCFSGCMCSGGYNCWLSIMMIWNLPASWWHAYKCMCLFMHSCSQLITVAWRYASTQTSMRMHICICTDVNMYQQKSTQI